MFLVLHYFRYVPETVVTFGATTATIPADWYNLPTFLDAIEDGSTLTMTWTSSTNVVAASSSCSFDTTQAQDLLGWSSGAASTSTVKPKATWLPESPEYIQEKCPIGVNGKKTYDTDFYTSQSGNTWALGSVDVYSEKWSFNYIKKYDIFTLTGGISQPFVDIVYRPDLSIVFELKYAASIDWSTGYTAGQVWCHTGEPSVVMQMPPWDTFYSVMMEANKYGL